MLTLWLTVEHEFIFEPIIDEINEVSYLKKRYNLFHKNISNFVSNELLEK